MLILIKLVQFLDFPNIHQWHTSQWIKVIQVRTPGKTSGMELVEGDKMYSEISGMSFNQTILVSTAKPVLSIYIISSYDLGVSTVSYI
jgi:hypothetical protein